FSDVPLAVSLVLDAVDAIAGDRGRPLQQHARDLGAIADGAPLVVDRFTGRRAGLCGLLERGIVELGAGERLAGRLDQQDGWRHGDQADARGHTGIALHSQADAEADHGDVHLGARDQAQIGVARTLWPSWQGQADDDLAGLERGLARTGGEFLDRDLAAAL